MSAERLLGGLVMGALGRGMRRDPRALLGLGAIAVAVAAWEHYQERRGAAPVGVKAPPVGPPPPPPVEGPPPPPGPRPRLKDGESNAVVLIRAMILAAHADGRLDPDERAAILERLGGAELSDEERAFLLAEMERPMQLDELMAAVTSSSLAEQVYAVSLLAMCVNSDAERQYIEILRRRLALPAETVERVHAILGVGTP